jgi:hypothetical protein
MMQIVEKSVLGVVPIEHPSTEDLEAFMAGRLSREEARGVVRHLLRGCALCSAEARKLWGPPEALLEPSRWKERPHGA